MKIKKVIRRPRIFFLSFFLLVLFLCIGGYASITIWPSAGAQAANILRGLMGDQAVAWLEGVAFQIQDTFQQWRFQLGEKPAEPWNSLSSDAALQPTIPALTILSTSPAQPSPSPEQSTLKPNTGYTPTPAMNPARWPPAPIPASGSLPGEGQWTPYFTNAEGQTVAYRTFLQPDPGRPYSIAAIVAIDLTKTNLHYVLGFEEPKTAVTVARTGIIPKEDRTPGVLLAAFNGGFQTRHGLYGIMVHGVTLLPMREGLGALAIFQDGHVEIGAWGSDFTSYDNISVLRQNGPLVLNKGQLNPLTNDNSIELWGATVFGQVATWRSAIGISADGKTLYYLAGWNLIMPTMALALKTAGVYSAIQLDINIYWVLFCTVHFDGSTPKASPLLDEMKENVDRYLYACANDYFYISAATE